MVRADLMKYNDPAQAHGGGGGGHGELGIDTLDMLDTGWKALSGDVFRCPPHRLPLSCIVGAGAQLLSISVIILVLGSTNIVNVYHRGSVYSAGANAYAITSAIAGYVSARQYARLGGVRWVWCVNVTSMTFLCSLRACFGCG
jgi:hypothetical protein